MSGGRSMSCSGSKRWSAGTTFFLLVLFFLVSFFSEAAISVSWAGSRRFSGLSSSGDSILVTIVSVSEFFQSFCTALSKEIVASLVDISS